MPTNPSFLQAGVQDEEGHQLAPRDRQPRLRLPRRRLRRRHRRGHVLLRDQGRYLHWYFGRFIELTSQSVNWCAHIHVSAKAGLALPEGDLLGGPVSPVPEATRQTSQRGDRLNIKVSKLPNRKHWFKVTVSVKITPSMMHLCVAQWMPIMCHWAVIFLTDCSQKDP